MLIVVSGSRRDHHLDLDQDLLNCHQGVEDEVKCSRVGLFIFGDWFFFRFDFVLMVFLMQVAGSWQCAAGASVHFLQLIATFAKSCILLEVCEYDG